MREAKTLRPSDLADRGILLSGPLSAIPTSSPWALGYDRRALRKFLLFSLPLLVLAMAVFRSLLAALGRTPELWRLAGAAVAGGATTVATGSLMVASGAVGGASTLYARMSWSTFNAIGVNYSLRNIIDFYLVPEK